MMNKMVIDIIVHILFIMGGIYVFAPYFTSLIGTIAAVVMISVALKGAEFALRL